MPSLDDTTRALWLTPRPPLALLFTAGCSRAATAGLSEAQRAPFAALSTAILSWWPDKKRDAREIFGVELTACLDLYGAAEDAKVLDPALEAAYHQMFALRQLAPGAFSLHEIGAQDGYDAESLIKLVRKLAKLGQTDLDTWKGRLEHLLSFLDLSGKDAEWPQLVLAASRIGFDRPMQSVKKLPKPLQELAKLADLGAVTSWSTMGPKHALLLQLGKFKRTAVLDDTQRTELLEALPWLA